MGCTTKGAGKSLVISLHEKPTVEKVQISSGAYQDLARCGKNILFICWICLCGVIRLQGILTGFRGSTPELLRLTPRKWQTLNLPTKDVTQRDGRRVTRE